MSYLLKGGYWFNQENVGINFPLPLVSVITVCFNAENYIEDCIKSVLAQSSVGVEHIIVDGKSKDNTINILKKYDQDIACWISEEDNGIYEAMNKATLLARGKWLLFLGADDALRSGFSEMAAYLKDSSCIYYGDVWFKNARMGGRHTSYKLAKHNICHHAIFYPRVVFNKFSYQERYKISADHFLNIQCWADPSFNWVYKPVLIADFGSEGISSHQKDKIFEKDRRHIIRNYLGISVYCRYLFRSLKGAFK